jgi:hypothetical protein
MKLSFSTKALGALAGVAMVAATMTSPASAFTLSSPAADESYSSAPVEKVWWRHGCWHCGGYGWGWHRHWGPGWGYGGRHCWMSPWGWRCRYW